MKLVRTSLGFGREDRLRRRTDFNRVYELGRRVGARGFNLFYTRGKTGRHRIGLTVPRRVGDAVARNRVRRRLREIFRHNRGALGVSVLDVVLNVSTAGAGATLRELEGEFRRAAEAAGKGRGRPPRSRRRRGPRSSTSLPERQRA